MKQYNVRSKIILTYYLTTGDCAKLPIHDFLLLYEPENGKESSKNKILEKISQQSVTYFAPI